MGFPGPGGHTAHSSPLSEGPFVPDRSSLTDLLPCSVEQVEICVKDLSVFTYVPWSWQYIRTAVLNHIGKRDDDSRPQPPALLRNISATIPQGSLTAIIGGSGSGKTTLLNAIAGRRSAWTAKHEGSTTFNGRTKRNGIRMTYLPQEDILHPTLTVRETLQYAADLSLAPSMDKTKRRALVELVMDDLGVQLCADNRTAQACSNSQRRRTSIAMQILTNSSIVLCDEPTTGLDATSALQIVRSLKRLAKAGRTVVISIHAPRPGTWELFDQVVLLSQGSAIYAAPASESIDYFHRLGYTPPENVNPAEFLVDLAAVDTRTTVLETNSIQRIDSLAKTWQSHWMKQQLHEVPYTPPDRHKESNIIETRDSRFPSFTQQMSVLTRRTFKTTLRDRTGLAGTMIRATGMAVLNGWIFFGLDGSLAGIRSRQGSFYVASNLNGYITLLHEVLRFSSDVQAFFRERNDGQVGVPAFLMSRVAARAFLEDLLAPLLFSAIFYFMVGFRTDAGQFFIFFVYCILTHYTAISFAVICVGLTGRFAPAILACNLSFALQSFTCGYFIQTQQIPVYVRWLKWCSYMFYIYSGLCANEFTGQFYSCPVSQNPSDPACRQYVGDAIIDDLGFPSDWSSRPIVVGIAFVLGFYILGGMLLCTELPQARLWKARRRDAAAPPDVEPTGCTNMNPEKHHILVKLQSYGLVRRNRNWLGRVTRNVRVLGPITTEFKPGQLNVIMGPGGSGKTSLLNSLARRRPQSSRIQFNVQGVMLYNGAIPSAQVIRSVMSLVGQDKSGLISLLTVRETIRFAAELRLPAWMPRAKKLYRAEDMIRIMGLKGCADNMVQSISGGECRRVMIAVQLLTEPRVLLLDEPTSGLDVFTAQSLVELLGGLAMRGQTIIMTVQQTRASSFCHFSHVLLLDRAGQQVYSASGENMIPYFTSLGYFCPEHTNKADFVLDLVSDDHNGNILREAWDQCPPSCSPRLGSITSPAQLGSLAKVTNPLRVTFPVAFRRSALSLWRSPTLFLTRSLQVVVLGAVIMLFYAPLHHDYQSVQSRMGFVQEFAAFYFVGLMQNAVVYPGERDIFYSEQADGCHSTESFLLQYTLLEVVFEIGASLIFGVFAAFVCDLDRTVKMFLVCAANCAFILSCGESIGIMVSTVFSHRGLAVNIISILLSISTVLGGIMSLHVNSFLSALNYLSPVKYLIANLASYSMQGQTFTCTEVQRLPNGQCPIADGAQVLALYNLDKNAGLNLMGLGICTVAYRLLAYALLWFRQCHVVDNAEKLLSWLRLNETST